MFCEYICLYVERPWPLFCKNENWISASKELTTMTYKIIPFKVSTTFCMCIYGKGKNNGKWICTTPIHKTDETDMGCFLKTLICGCMYMDKKDNIFNKYLYIYIFASEWDLEEYENCIYFINSTLHFLLLIEEAWL